MEEKKDMDFYGSLTKKKLQVLCKKYGLSPYMTKSNLAKSLYSFSKKKTLSSVSPIGSPAVDFVTCIPMETIHASKDRHVKISCAMEKETNINDYRAVECVEEVSLVGTENCGKAPDYKIIKGSLYPDNDENDSTFTCLVKETLGSPSASGCRENGFDCGVDLESVDCDKNNISSQTEAGENLSIQIPTKNLFHDLALAGNASTLEKSSKPFSSLEFHASSGTGISIIVDLDASPSDLRKIFKNEVCNCHFVHSSKIQSLREELELLGNNNQYRFSLWRSDTEKPVDHSIPQDSCYNVHFSDISCQQKKASCSPSRGSMHSDVAVPMVKFEKGHDDSAISGTCAFAEEQELAKLVGDAETSVNFHPNISLKEKPLVKVGVKRKRPSSNYNLRLLTKRVLPRRSMRLVGAQRL